MMQKIKIFFSDFWKGFNPVDNFIMNKLSNVDIIIDPNPDFLFYSSHGNEHRNFHNCVKIYFTGENDVPDFNYCDYAISFHPINFQDRHLRFPLYLLYKDCHTAIMNQKNFSQDSANRKFCNFVYSNSNLADPFRDSFFYKLSKYKKVDSGGRHLNNIGGAIADKIAFIKDYKFTIAFENSSVRGYTTEKIIEPMSVNSLPIYWGNPEVDTDFNEKSFIWIKDKSKINEIIDYIVYLDENEESYINKLSNSWLTTEQSTKDWDFALSTFLYNIINQGFPLSKRTTDYGYVKLLRSKESLSIKRILSIFK